MNELDFNLIEKTATHYHRDQMYGDKPYMYHIKQVVNYALKYGYLLGKESRSTAFAAAWLHDIIEDTTATFDTVLKVSNHDVAFAVHCLTDESGANRKERKARTWWKIRQNHVATYVKLCDRIANVSNSAKIKMYADEQPLFEAALYRPGQFEPMWVELNRMLEEFRNEIL